MMFQALWHSLAHTPHAGARADETMHALRQVTGNRCTSWGPADSLPIPQRSHYRGHRAGSTSCAGERAGTLPALGGWYGWKPTLSLGCCLGRVSTGRRLDGLEARSVAPSCRTAQMLACGFWSDHAVPNDLCKMGDLGSANFALSAQCWTHFVVHH